MARVSDLHNKWMDNAEYRKAWNKLEGEFALAATLIEARKRAGLTQAELARRMRTTQPTVARLESGRVRPSMRTLERIARATGNQLLISFRPSPPTRRLR